MTVIRECNNCGKKEYANTNTVGLWVRLQGWWARPREFEVHACSRKCRDALSVSGESIKYLLEEGEVQDDDGI